MRWPIPIEGKNGSGVTSTVPTVATTIQILSVGTGRLIKRPRLINALQTVTAMSVGLERNTLHRSLPMCFITPDSGALLSSWTGRAAQKAVRIIARSTLDLHVLNTCCNLTYLIHQQFSKVILHVSHHLPTLRRIRPQFFSVVALRL